MLIRDECPDGPAGSRAPGRCPRWRWLASGRLAGIRVGARAGGRTPDELLIPPRFAAERLLGSPRVAMAKTLLQLPHAEPQNYTEQVGDVLALIAGTYRSPQGEEAHVVPGEGAALQIWILGSSGGESAEAGGQLTARELAAGYGLWSAASAPPRVPFSSRSPSRPAATGGPTRTVSWSPTVSTRSSSETRARSSTSWNASATPPKPTN
ncbi:MAG TPA: hypothetical protein VKU77_18070 [Streptosporangiaceae bacterium]|nr:hypothetical protein [Streptosporangiaceae bacterium]